MKAARALKEASIMVDVLIDLEVANFRALEMAAKEVALAVEAVAS